MSSYFDYFCKHIDKDNSKSNEFITGTCYAMCPPDEEALREKEQLVHVLEVLGSERKLVKCYSRSAADSYMAIPRHLRPYSILKDTVDYLLLDVSRRNDVPTPILYDFINDRLRAVRQDITIQRLPPDECVNLLEPMVRFYVYFGFRLCQQSIKDFDPVLNKKYLLECIKWFLTCCNEVEKKVSPDISELSTFLSKLELDTRNLKNLVCDPPLIESLYILCNLDDLHPLIRYLSLPKDFKSNPTIKLAYTIAIARLKGDYIEICRLAQLLCPLSYCALCVHLPAIQRQALQVMSFAYNSKQLTVPSSALTKWLWFANDADAVATCAHYGLKIEGAGVRFCKTDFKTDVPTHQPKKNYRHEETLNLNIDNIFTYCSLK